MTTKRKPYVRKMHTNWWRKLEYYRFYMVREATAVASIWFSILLIYGVAALRSPDRWTSFVDFLANPIVLLINIVVLLAALLHTFTWFRLTPKAVRISEEKEKLMIKGLWAITIIASVVILAIGFC